METDIALSAQYLQSFFESGSRPMLLAPTPEKIHLEGVPVWANQMASFYKVVLREAPLIFIALKEVASVDSVARLYRVFSRSSDLPGVLVADPLPPRTSGPLSRLGVPHLFTGRSIFAPNLGVLFRGRSDSTKDRESDLRERLVPVAQKVLVLHLLRPEAIDRDWTLADWSKKLGKLGLAASSSGLSRAFHQLHLLEFVSVLGSGPKKKIEFEDRTVVWAKLARLEVETVLKKVRSMDCVPKDKQLYAFSADSALARLTSLSESNTLTIAMSTKAYEEWKRKDSPDNAQNGSGNTEQSVVIELWRENPRFLAEDDCLNAIELALYMRRSSDPRIREAVADLISKKKLDPNALWSFG